MITQNKGEWSELYVFLKLLGNGILYAADANLNKIEDLYYPLIEILRKENKQIIQRKIYINDVPYPLNIGYKCQSKNGQAIHQNMEDNNIRNNNITNKNGHKNFISNYTAQRQYPPEFFESLYAN